MTDSAKSGQRASPADRLKAEATSLIGALGDRAMASVRSRVQEAAGRLTDYVEDGGGPGLMAAVTGAKDMAEGKSPVRSLASAGMTAVKEGTGALFGGGKGSKGGGKGRNLKVTNIVETIDIGAPLRLTYDMWTQFADFPSFMKKVENVEQEEAQILNWKAQILWSHRTWESTILEQAPDDKIIWRSKGAKGHVDGAVTFHELAPNLTRILLVMEYYPQGLFEHTGNIWRAQGRRTRLELKHFRRHVMSEVLLHPDEVQGWRGVIKDGEVQDDADAPADQEGHDAEGDEDINGEEEDDDQDSSDDQGEDEDQDSSDDQGEDEDQDSSDDEDEEQEEQEDDRRGRRRSRQPARGGRQPAGRSQQRPQRPQRPRDDRPEEPSSPADRPRRVTRRATARGGARS